MNKTLKRSLAVVILSIMLIVGLGSAASAAGRGLVTNRSNAYITVSGSEGWKSVPPGGGYSVGSGDANFVSVPTGRCIYGMLTSSTGVRSYITYKYYIYTSIQVQNGGSFVAYNVYSC